MNLSTTYNIVKMMDWYSNYPAPSKEEAIKEVTKEIGEEEYVREVITKMLSLGSYTGWYVGFKGDVIKEVKKMVEDRNKKEMENKKVNTILQHITGDGTFTW